MKYLYLLLIPTVLLCANEKSYFDKTLDKAEPALKYVHDKLNLSSKYIDEFLTQQNDETIYADSFIRLENSIRKAEGSSISYNTDLDVKIHLPKLKEKLSLTLDNKEQRRDEEFEDSNENVPFQDDKYNLGLLYNPFKESLNLKFKGGLKLTDDPYFFIQAQAERKFDVTTNSDITFRQRFKYSKRNELETTSSLQYTYHLIKDKLAISNYNEYFINEDDDINNFYNSIRLYQHLTDKNYINYVFGVYSNDSGHTNIQVKEYRAYVSYRHYIRDWLYYDVIPMNTIDAIEHDDTYSLEFRLGILIK